MNIGSRRVSGAAALLPRPMAPADQLRRSMAWVFGIGGGGVWCDLRLASLLTHLFSHSFKKLKIILHIT